VCCEQHELAGPLIIEADQTARTAWDDDPISMTYCRLLMARVESIRGNRPRGRSWMIEAGQMMELLEPTDPWVIGTRPYVIGQIAFMGGNPREAVPLLGEAAHLLDHHGDRANATICFAEMAFAAETYGDYDTMRDALHNAQRIAHEFNLTSIELVLAARIGCAAVLQGHHDEAEVLLDEVLRSARDVAHRPALAYALTGVARLRFRQGRMAEAEAAAREALAFPLLDQTQVRASSLEILEAINAT